MHQGSIRTSFLAEPLESAGFSRCHAVIIRNSSNGKVVMLHVEPLGISYERQKVWIDGQYKDSLLGLGEGPKEAIIVEGSASSAGGLTSSEMFLKDSGIKIVKEIRASTGNYHWAVAYDPSKNRIYVTSKTEKKVFEISGFDNFDATKLSLNNLVNAQHPFFGKIDKELEEKLDWFHRNLKKTKGWLTDPKFKPGSRDLIEQQVAEFEKRLAALQIFNDAFSAYKNALIAIKEGDIQKAHNFLKNPKLLDLIEKEFYVSPDAQNFMYLLEFGERVLLPTAFRLDSF